MDYSLVRYGMEYPYYQVWGKDQDGPLLVALIEMDKEGKYNLTYEPIDALGIVDLFKLEKDVEMINLGLYHYDVFQFLDFIKDKE